MRVWLPVAFAAAALMSGGAPVVHGQPPGWSPGAPEPDLDAALAEALDEAERAANRRARIDTEIEGLDGQRRAARRRLRERVRALYRLRRAGVLPLAGGFDALLRHQSRVSRLERMVARDMDGLASLRRRLGALGSETARLAEQAEAAQRRVSALRQRRQSQHRDLEILSEMIEDPEAWAAPSWGAGPGAGMAQPSGFGLRLSDPPAQPSSFAQHRGNLPLPVGGSARLADAEREGGAGLEMAATAGVPVRSVAGGRVAYAASHPAYGRLVMVEHGGGHYSVYGGLGAIAVSAGQPVAREGVVGSVGTQPIFFQVRRGTRPLPAREWLGL